jgi:zinc transport system substrate-binding protein
LLASSRATATLASAQRCLLVLLLTAVLLPTQGLASEGVVYTGNYPLHYFASAIAGDDLEVVFPAPPEIDPAYWRPDVDALLAYQRADLVLLNGAGFERWVAKAALPRSRLVDTSAAFAARLIAERSARTPHVHGPEGAHVHRSATAFTTWLDLSLARAQAQAVRDAMAARWPALAAGFTARHAALDARLEKLDAALETAAAVHAGKPLLASHPVYQYLARRYRLDVASLHWEPDSHPDDDAWRALEAILASHPAKLMLWEDEPRPETRARLAALGVAVVVFPPLGNRPASGDFEGVLRAAAARLGGA